MSQEIVKNQFIIVLRNGMTAYIIADNLEDIAKALQNNKFFNTKEQMMVNTADIVAIMSPVEYVNQQKYQRGWYMNSKNTRWYNKKGEYEEETDLGISLEAAITRANIVSLMEEGVEKEAMAKRLIAKARERGVHSLIQTKAYTDLLTTYFPDEVLVLD